MGNETDPQLKRPVSAEDLPPELIHVGGERSDDRVRGNPGAHEHELTYSSIMDVSGQQVRVVEIKTISYDANQVRVEPRVRKKVIEAPSLWREDLEDHHIATHALRLL